MQWCSTSYLLLTVLALSLASPKVKILSDEFIESINNLKPTWVAGRNFPEDTSEEHLRRIGSGGLRDPNVKIQYIVHNITLAIPESFDSRSAWPNCEDSITNIRNQGACGSCWAFGAVEVMSDRLCIQSGGARKFNFSPEDVLSCCTSCGDCSGGYASLAWDYWINSGIVSGGEVGSTQGCKPYSNDAFNGITPPCSQSCESSYSTSYENDKLYGSTRYYAGPGIEQIQTEIMTNGPVEAFMEIYEDFYNYKSGVYTYTTGSYMGNHFVKMIGWGVEGGVPYWLMVNSWGADWGDGGVFKILRGQNHVQIEQQLDAGTPIL